MFELFMLLSSWHIARDHAIYLMHPEQPHNVRRLCKKRSPPLGPSQSTISATCLSCYFHLQPCHLLLPNPKAAPRRVEGRVAHSVSRKTRAVLSQGPGRPARFRCKFRYVTNFTTALCGFSATARLSCWSLSADCSELSVKK